MDHCRNILERANPIAALADVAEHDLGMMFIQHRTQVSLGFHAMDLRAQIVQQPYRHASPN